jgi:hypothetical protein
MALDCKALQRGVWIAQYITGAELLAIQELYIRWCQRKAQRIAKDSSHPSHRLFGKRYSSIGSRTNRL